MPKKKRAKGRATSPSAMFADAILSRMNDLGIRSVNALYERVKDRGITRAHLYYFLRGQQKEMTSDKLALLFDAMNLGVTPVYGASHGRPEPKK